MAALAPLSFIFSIRLNRRPVCPGCMEPLNTQVLRFVDNVAMCENCTGGGFWSGDEIAAVCRHPLMARYMINSQGLLWYAPPDIFALDAIQRLTRLIQAQAQGIDPFHAFDGCPRTDAD